MWDGMVLEYLVSQGVKVVVNDLAMDAAANVAAEIVAAGHQAIAIAASVTDQEAVASTPAL